MWERIRKILDCPLPKAYCQGLQNELFRTGFWPMILVGLFTLLFELSMMIITMLRPVPAGSAASIRLFFSLYIVLFAVTLLFLAFSILYKQRLQKKPGIFFACSFVYDFIICFWGSLISAITHRSHADVTVFIYVVFGTAIFIALRPWQAIVLYGVNQLFLIGALLYFRAPEVSIFGSVINSVIATFLAILVSSILYRGKASNYYNRAQIIEQNKQIQLINNQLQDMVLIDNLTGAHNRRFLDDVLPEIIEDAHRAEEPVAALMMDIDRFKQYNDIYGHQSGDDCLVSIADIIRRTTSEDDSSFVRYGGEEFVVILTGYNQQQAIELAEELRRNVARAHIAHSGSPWGYVTLSIGVYYSKPAQVQDTVHQMIRYADQALYVAKNSGRNKVVLHTPQAAQLEARQWQESACPPQDTPE